MEKRLSLNRGPFLNPSDDLIESFTREAIKHIIQSLNKQESYPCFPDPESLLSSYEWDNLHQFKDTEYALSKFQNDINHALAINGGLDVLETGNYSNVKYISGVIFIL